MELNKTIEGEDGSIWTEAYYVTDKYVTNHRDDTPFEMGKIYELDPGRIEKYGPMYGFDACLCPLDALRRMVVREEHRFFKVQIGGLVVKNYMLGPTGRSCSKIKFVEELSYAEFIEEGTQWLATNNNVDGKNLNEGCECGIKWSARDNVYIAASRPERVAITSGEKSVVSSAGYAYMAIGLGETSVARVDGLGDIALECAHKGISLANGSGSVAVTSGTAGGSLATGDNSTAISVGPYSNSYAEKKDTIAITTGPFSRVMAKDIGCVLFSVQRDGWNGATYPIISVACGIVDGQNLMPNVWYECIDGKLVEYDPNR